MIWRIKNAWLTLRHWWQTNVLDLETETDEEWWRRQI